VTEYEVPIENQQGEVGTRRRVGGRRSEHIPAVVPGSGDHDGSRRRSLYVHTYILEVHRRPCRAKLMTSCSRYVEHQVRMRCEVETVRTVSSQTRGELCRIPVIKLHPRPELQSTEYKAGVAGEGFILVLDPYISEAHMRMTVDRQPCQLSPTSLRYYRHLA
jgi:hypothetical protein